MMESERIVYVDKHELLELLAKKINEDNERRMAVVDSDFIDLVNDATEINDVVEVVHGEWCWEGQFKACSECGSYVEWNETLGANFWKYCPYCGAKMDGGKNER